MRFEKVLEPELRHLHDDEEFKEKLFKKMRRSKGWGFMIRYKGLRIQVTALDGTDRRVAYLEKGECLNE